MVMIPDFCFFVSICILVDLALAHDTAWHHDLTDKHLRLLPDKHMARVIMALVSGAALLQIDRQ